MPMQFLKTLFWVLLAVFIALFASRNWSDVTLNLWGDIQVDIKLPVLMTLMFLAGFLPLFLIHRTRLWTIKRRLEVEQRQQLLATQSAQTDDAASAI
jgi:putative membrane protein